MKNHTFLYWKFTKAQSDVFKLLVLLEIKFIAQAKSSKIFTFEKLEPVNGIFRAATISPLIN